MTLELKSRMEKFSQRRQIVKNFENFCHYVDIEGVWVIH